MPEVSVVVELRVRVDRDVAALALEGRIAAEARRAGRELYEAALEALEELLLAKHPGARQRQESRWMATTMGRLRVERWRVAPAEGGSFHPLDRALGWVPRQEASAGLREAICDLCVRVPFREAAQITERLTGEVISHQSLWRLLQAEGAKVRTEEGKLVEAIFEWGEIPEEVLPAPTAQLVVLEADGTFLRAQREASDRFEVKNATAYTGKAPAGGKKHRRWRLLEKACYATTADSDAFGKGLAALGMARYGLHLVPNILCVHDGLDEWGKTFRDWLPGAIHQVDHFHIGKRLKEATGDDERAFKQLRRRVYADPAGTASRVRRGHYRVKPEHREELAGYLAGVAPDFWGIRRLPRHLRRGRMFIKGSGVIEKHQDLVVCRRMKGRGMRWTRRGADRLLALQARRHSGRWPTRWGVMPA